MKTKLFIISFLVNFVGFTYAYDEGQGSNGPNSDNEVLVLIVDYTTNSFEGGKILNFSQNQAETLTITNDYFPPGDCGFIKLYYSEIDELLFFGGIIWMGCGSILFPETWMAPEDFTRLVSADWVYPKNGFLNIFPVSNNEMTNDVWSRAQSILEVREFLSSNPEQKVQYFLYTPSVGMGNPADWKWILFLNKPSQVITSLNKQSPEFNIYLLITDSKLYINTNDYTWSYLIYNIKGQLLKSGLGNNEIDVSSLNQGIYILNIYSDNGDFMYSCKFNKK